jgi:ATP-dependent exoDNAse (exonuclease V) alpha subunit
VSFPFPPSRLGVTREAWEAAGYQVQGAALSGIAAENLERGSGIASRTIASMEHRWRQDRDLLTAHDILVIDEAGMVGTR